MLVLGIETSCDDTSVCILRAEDSQERPEILAHKSFSQELLLEKWGGVVPEIAARNHLEKINPLLENTFKIAGVNTRDINLIGVTTLPGLLGPLLTGLNTAKSLSLLYEIPIRAVNHLFAHLEAIHLTENIVYPYLGLLVSGGHGLFALVKSPTDFEILGSTIDDAPGEAFDKGGKLLGLGYPAGRKIDEIAKEGDPLAFQFPIGLQYSKDCSLSYSGVKSALRNLLQKDESLRIPQSRILEQKHKDLCASYQNAIVKALSLKLNYAIKIAQSRGFYNLQIVVGGGVACNSALRNELGTSFSNTYFVSPKFCTDNGAMIANYALITKDKAISFPECLSIDARGRYLDKTILETSKRNKIEQTSLR
ncbi:MAG: tRNA (adenosine(37)-N6)-threonylcarbamoyltransferase complex transferase subunit TsaD [Halobacteriovoraceae bacterium]|nr:tRNA (adenosine(37)-N6)-threonylcarbamoyltransferase complex transferase subunit TsaD [Halobacteriovoraceae bacterium]